MSESRRAKAAAKREWERRRTQATKATAPSDEGAARVTLGIEVPDGGDPFVALRVGNLLLRFNADEADELSVDIHGYALELRNGGRLA